MKTKMIYDLVKQVKETGVGADGTVVCSMDELVALVDYVEEEMYKKGRTTGYAEGRFESIDEDYEDDDYEDDYEDEYEDEYEDDYDDYEDEDDYDEDDYDDDYEEYETVANEEPTLEDLFKQWVATQIAKGR